MNEFQLIEKFFATHNHKRKDVLLGIGDDAALLQAPPNQTIAVSSDTLISGVHFPKNTNPCEIGYKSLAVNLSDLAAIGAKPAWVMLALTLPKVKTKWLNEFCKGFFELLDAFHMQLIGGDTTRGALAITVQVFGFVPLKQALKRSGAKPGDSIYVTGTLGDAGLALWYLQNKIKLDDRTKKFILPRLNCPMPRIAEGLLLRKCARSAIDISDGLAADLQHILEASKVGASICVDDLPLSSALTKTLKKTAALNFALNAGDDFELCFTVSPQQEKDLIAIAKKTKCKFTRIGLVEKQLGLRLHHENGKPYRGKITGYKHF